MAGYPPPYPPPFNPDPRILKYQRRIARDQARLQRDQYRLQMRALRRGSILGPLLVVALGVVFLLVQLGRLDHHRLFDWYSRWWPLLLVLAGTVLLVEWAAGRAFPPDPGRPYLRRRAGGGVVTLIVLLALGGALLHQTHGMRDLPLRGFAINPDNLAEFIGSKHESDQSLDREFAPKGILTVDNPRGDLTVDGTSTDGMVHIALHKQVYSSSDTDADTKARRLAPTITAASGTLGIAIAAVDGATVDLTLTVPPTATLALTANRGEIRVDTLQAPLTLTANHGDVTVSAVAGPVTAHVNHSGSSFSAHRVAGLVTVEGRAQDLTLSDIGAGATLAGDFYGATHLEHIRGPVRFHTSRTDFQVARLDGEIDISSERISAEQAAGPTVLTTRNRNIQLDRVSGELSVTNRNGTVDLTSAPPLGNVTVQNRNGSVNLTLPDRAGFTVNAQTDDGDLQNDFALPARESGNRRSLDGTVGKGGSLIRIATSQGDVALHRASILPIAPAPPPPPPEPAQPGFSLRDGEGASVSVGRDGVRITTGPDGSKEVVGRDGVRVTTGPDGSKEVVGRDGVRITTGPDGSSSYTGRDGTRLAEGPDGTRVYTGPDGTRYTESADGDKIYVGRDGTRIVIQADGHREVTARGNTLSDADVDRLLRRAQDDLRRAESRRDAERVKATGH